MSPETQPVDEYEKTTEFLFGLINSPFHCQFEVEIYKRKDGKEHKAKIKVPNRIPFTVYGVPCEEVYIDDRMVGEGLSQHGACVGLANLIENKIVMWSWDKIMAVAPESKRTELREIREAIKEFERQGSDRGKINH